jgi:hypothetical protein
MFKTPKTTQTTEPTNEAVIDQGNLAVKVEAGTPAYDADAYASRQNTSQRIRFLASAGWSKGQIAKHLGKRYQHVRNVLVTPVKAKS